MPKIHFTKMHGTGNDFVYINGFEQEVNNAPQLAKTISDRHFGVGSDGLVIILPSATADIRMRMFNADGTEAEMCGNAGCCVGKFAYEKGLVNKDIIRLETASGIKIINLLSDAGSICGATVDMGAPELDPRRIPITQEPDLLSTEEPRFIARPVQVGERTYAVTGVSLGTPHAVVFTENLTELNVRKLGPLFEHHRIFPKRISVAFVQVQSSTEIQMRCWERGTGEVLASGTGACAAAVASVLNEYTERVVDVHSAGGTLHVKWEKADGHIYMTGAAQSICEGDFFL